MESFRIRETENLTVHAQSPKPEIKPVWEAAKVSHGSTEDFVRALGLEKTVEAFRIRYGR